VRALREKGMKRVIEQILFTGGILGRVLVLTVEKLFF